MQDVHFGAESNSSLHDDMTPSFSSLSTRLISTRHLSSFAERHELTCTVIAEETPPHETDKDYALVTANQEVYAHVSAEIVVSATGFQPDIR
jgi:hypothetical protein